MKISYFYSAIAMIVSFISMIAAAVFGVIDSMGALSEILVPVYYIFYVLTLLASLYAIWGFVKLAKDEKNTALLYGSYLQIIGAFIIYPYSILTFRLIEIQNPLFEIGVVVVFGLATIPFGMGLMQLKKTYGTLASVTGILTIIAGVSMASVILIVIGLPLYFILYILYTILMFRAAERSKEV